MPQLVKGGKYVYGWSKVSHTGKIVIPHEAVEEYNLAAAEKVILIPGSKRSGGFGLTTVERLQRSVVAGRVNESPLADFHIPEGEITEINGTPYCWVRLCDESITVPEKTLKRYQINPGDWILSVRGSNLAIGFPVRGPIIEEAKKHSEIEVFE
jgi:bifunctional DNA-binding transcriptional regulator/antitoxin component of YhaV-PrlF toxin-antitoxin module